MNIELLDRSITYIDDALILAADISALRNASRKTVYLRFLTAAACVLILASGILTYRLIHPGKPPAETLQPETVPDTVSNDNVPEERYVYHITDGPFASYTAGKVISEELVGDQIGKTTVRGAWHYYYGEESTGAEEVLRAEIYEIKAIPKETAVCIRFLDKGDALTTTHYYVQINPDADPENVKDYIIGSESMNSRAEGTVQEIGSESVITYTSASGAE